MIQLVGTIIFIVGMISFIILSVIIVYHLLKFSFRKKKAREIAMVYVAVSLILAIITTIYFFQVSWEGIMGDANFNL